MRIRQWPKLVILLFAGVTATAALAREVTIPHNGLTLNASYELAAGKTPADGVILITHGGLAHRDMEMISYLQSLLVKEKGYSTLAINLSLGLDNRHNMYDCQQVHRHRNEDAANEINVWLKWLGTQGVKKVTLLGHSRGGAQTALNAAQQKNSMVMAVVLIAPATLENTDASGYQRRYQKALEPVVAKAQSLKQSGQANALLEHVDFLNCADTSVSADSFLSYYGPAARVDTPTLIPEINKPVLVLVAGEDEVVVNLDKKLSAVVDGRRVQMKVIDGSGHFFRDLYSDDAVEVIDAFLRGVGYRR